MRAASMTRKAKKQALGVEAHYDVGRMNSDGAAFSAWRALSANSISRLQIVLLFFACALFETIRLTRHGHIGVAGPAVLLTGYASQHHQGVTVPALG